MAVLSPEAPTAGPYDYVDLEGAFTAEGVHDLRVRLRGALRLAHVGFSGWGSGGVRHREGARADRARSGRCPAAVREGGDLVSGRASGCRTVGAVGPARTAGRPIPFAARPTAPGPTPPLT